MSRALDMIAALCESEPYELTYRIPGKGSWKRKEFDSEKKRTAFIDKLLAKEGDDVETRTRDPRK